MSTLDQFASTREVGCCLLWTYSNGFEGSIGIFGHQRLVALNQGLGVAQHMRFTDLVLHPHLIGDRLEAIGIIRDQHLGSHALGNGLNPLFERLAIFC